MESDKHYFRVGVYLIGLMLAAAGFAMWLASQGEESDERYRIYFAESVSGLSEGSPVKYRGVNVGRVDNVAISSKDSRLIRVDIRIRESTPVKTDTVAALKLQGVTGTVFVELAGGDIEAQPLAEVTPKGKTPVISSQQSSINAVMTQLPQIMEQLAKFAEQMNKLTSDDNIGRLSEAFDNIAESSGDIRQTLKDTRGNVVDSTQQINGTMTNLRRASRNVNIVTEQIKDDPSSLIFPSEEEGIPAP